MPVSDILIVCYSFPPHPGIGGRRWAKFCKYLSLNHLNLEVFNARNIFEVRSQWLSDVIQPEVHINSFAFTLQETMQNPVTLFRRAKRKLARGLCNLTKYTPDMITSLPNRKFWAAVEKMIREKGIRSVIVSGDPFLFYYAAKLKKSVDFELLLDYRDLWNDHSFYASHVKLTARQKRFFEDAENFAVNNCDKIIFVDDHLKKVVAKRVHKENVKLYTIPNGFDKADIGHLVNPGKVAGGRLKIFFCGNISSDLNSLLIDFTSAFSELKSTDPQTWGSIEIGIHGNFDDLLAEKLGSFKLQNLQIKKAIVEKDLYYGMLNDADVGLVILSPEYKNSFGTKFSDYLFMNKFILSIGEPGVFSQLTESGKIGLNYTPGMGPEFFTRLKKAFADYVVPDRQLLDEFDVEKLTGRLLKVINQ